MRLTCCIKHLKASTLYADMFLGVRLVAIEFSQYVGISSSIDNSIDIVRSGKMILGLSYRQPYRPILISFLHIYCHLLKNTTAFNNNSVFLSNVNYICLP